MEWSPPGEKQDRVGVGTNPYAVLSARALSGFTPLHSKSRMKRQNRAMNGCSANRATIRSPARLRIAMGLVAAERSPRAYPISTVSPEQQAFEREFTWFKWLVIGFALLHLVILLIIWTAPR